MNITEGEKDLASYTQVNTILAAILRAFNLVSKKKISGETVIELALKTLINIIESEPQHLEQFDGIKDLLSIIQVHYKDF